MDESVVEHARKLRHLVSAQVARIHGVLPWKVEGETLFLLCQPEITLDLPKKEELLRLVIGRPVALRCSAEFGGSGYGFFEMFESLYGVPCPEWTSQPVGTNVVIILLVDTDKDELDRRGLELQELGFEVVAVSSMQDALEVVTEENWDFYKILLPQRLHLIPKSIEWRKLETLSKAPLEQLEPFLADLEQELGLRGTTRASR